MRTFDRHGRSVTLAWTVLAFVALALVCTGCCRPVRSPATPSATAPEAPIVGQPATHQEATPDSASEGRTEQVRGQLHAKGRWLAYPDASRFRWRGVTGFMLNEQVAGGREADAVAFLKWAKQTGFNVVRVLAMLPKGWFTDKDFSPEEGLAALPRTLALARENDMYVELTVLANTASLPAKADLGSYVERAGRICATAANCALVEVANEFYHGTQRADVHDPITLATWAGRVPPGIPTALGAPPDEIGSLVASAPVITIHLDPRPERWYRLRRVRTLELLSAETGRFVIDNEAVGADEVERAQKRDNSPETFFAQGALSRLFEVGSNFHFEDGLRAAVPRPIQQRCAEAFVAGTRIVNDSYMLTFHDAGRPFSPVQKVRLAASPANPGVAAGSHGGLLPDSVVAAYAGLTQVFPESVTPSNVLLLIGLDGDPGIEWRKPWGKTGVIAALPHVQVWSIARIR